MGFTAAWRIPRKAMPIALMVVTFVAIGIFHWPLIWTVLGAGSVSVALSYFNIWGRRDRCPTPSGAC